MYLNAVEWCIWLKKKDIGCLLRETSAWYSDTEGIEIFDSFYNEPWCKWTTWSMFFDAIDTNEFDICDTKHDTNLIQMTLIHVIQLWYIWAMKWYFCCLDTCWIEAMTQSFLLSIDTFWAKLWYRAMIQYLWYILFKDWMLYV